MSINQRAQTTKISLKLIKKTKKKKKLIISQFFLVLSTSKNLIEKFYIPYKISKILERGRRRRWFRK